MKIERYITLLTMAAILMLWPVSAEAQQVRSSGDIGIGGQIGSPSGLTLQVYNPDGISYDLLAAWDLDDFYFFNVHGLYDQHIGQTQRAHVFFGPGVYAGFRDRPGNNETVAGISGTFGMGFLFMPMEIFAQLTPRLDLTPATDGEIGGGIGFRFYF